MKKPIVLNGNGEAPNAVPSSDAISTFQPRPNSLRLGAAAPGDVMAGKHTRSGLFGADAWE